MRAKNIKKSMRIIDQIQKIRSKNNKNWMDLLRLSFKLDYNNTSKILSEIYLDDQKISKLVKKLKVKNKKYR
tara:strand:+ start:20 stop:235 length:216 start_codon:yes stop_codon:yes gene_type:complete